MRCEEGSSECQWDDTFPPTSIKVKSTLFVELRRERRFSRNPGQLPRLSDDRPGVSLLKDQEFA